MTKTPYKIGAEDYDMLKDAKLKETALYKEQVRYQQDRTIKINRLRILQKTREIEYKQQLIAENKMLEYHDGFADKLKPKFFLLNEIDQLHLDIAELEDQIKKIEEQKELEKKSEEGDKNV